MAETAELALFDAIEEYVARALEPMQREMAALRAELANRMKGDPGVKGDPGPVAEVDYDRVGEILALAADKAVANAIAAVPKAKDGEPGKDAVVDYSVVREFVTAAAVSAVAALPKAKDGSPGKDADEAVIVERVLARITVPKDGAPGRDADEDAIVQRVFERIPTPKDGRDADDGVIVARVLAQIPTPKDGAPGVDGKDVDQARAAALITHEVTRQVALIRQPEDGKSITVDDVRPLLEKMVVAQVATIPAAKDGRDADESAVVARVLEQIPVPKDGRDGADGKDGTVGPNGKDGADGLNGKDAEPIHQDTVRVMLSEVAEEVVAKHVARIPAPKDGKDADPVQLAVMVDSKIASQFEELLPYLKGEPGPAGLSPEDLEVEFKGDRTLLVRFVRDGVSLAERPVRIAGIPIEKGLYVRGARYDCGDVVTYGGSAFIAVRDTSAEIGGTTKSPDWRLLVQRGRDAT